jgi:hypothetical protein
LDSVILLSLLPSCFPSHFPCPCSSGSSCKQKYYSLNIIFICIVSFFRLLYIVSPRFHIVIALYRIHFLQERAVETTKQNVSFRCCFVTGFQLIILTPFFFMPRAVPVCPLCPEEWGERFFDAERHLLLCRDGYHGYPRRYP